MVDQATASALALPPPMVLLDRAAQVAQLAEVCVDDMLSSLGLEQLGITRPWFRLLCRPLVQRFVRQVVIYDELVGLAGLQAGQGWMLEQFAPHVDVRGVHHLPASGPLLVVANHPGVADGSALLANIARADLRIIAANNAFIRALPQTSRYLFPTNNTQAGRLQVIRRSARHLRDGGAMLLFPGGEIETDPSVLLPDALDALQAWSASMDLFARLAPEVVIVPAAVSHVFSPQTLRSRLLRLRREHSERRRLAALLQVLVPRLQTNVVRLTFGAPIRAAGVTGRPDRRISQLVLAEMRRLLQESVSAVE